MSMRRAIFAAVLAAFMGAATTAAAELTNEELKAALEKRSDELGGDYVMVGRAKLGGLSEGQTAKFDQVLRKGACYRFAAVGGVEVADLDMKIFSGARIVASDSGTVASPVVEYCASKDIKARVTLQMYDGTGAFAMGIFAKGEIGDSGGALANLEAAARISLEKYAAAIAGTMDPLGEPVTGTLGHRNSETLDVTLDLPRCYKFIAVGGEGVQDLTMSVIVDGKEVASDRISGQKPVAQWCAPGRVNAKVKLTMYGGAGAFAVGVYGAKKASVVSPEKVGGPEKDFIANRIRQIHVQYGKGRAAVSQVLRGNLSTNNEKVFKVKLTAGHCYTIVGVGCPSVKDLEISVIDNGRELQKDKTRNGYPVMDTDPCPTFTGQYIIKAKMIRGFGQFGIQVFSD